MIMANQNHRYTRLTSFFSTTTMFILLRQHPPINLQVFTEIQAWISDAFSAPAWNRTIFVNQPQFLLGDYLISTLFMMSLWERYYLLVVMNLKHGKRLLLFFERLGGQ